MPRSIEQILAIAKDPAYAAEEVAKIALVPKALRDEHAAKDARLQEIIKNRDTVDTPTEQIELAHRLKEIQDEIDANTETFRFRCIGRRAWADLQRKHPPTPEQINHNKKVAPDQMLDHNVDTFPYEAMSLSCVEPEMTIEQVRELETVVDQAEWITLWSACWRVNMASPVPKSVAAGLILRRNGSSVTTPVNTESLAASS